MISKFYINSIPVYRKEINGDYIYMLFELNEYRSTIHISSKLNFDAQMKLVLKYIKDRFDDKNVKCVEEISEINRILI